MEISWFNVYDSTAGLWLQDDEKEWGPYHGAAEFTDYQLAHDIAERECGKGDNTIVVFADCGSI